VEIREFAIFVTSQVEVKKLTRKTLYFVTQAPLWRMRTGKMKHGVTVRKKKRAPVPRSSEEIRFEYIMQLWDELQRHQDEWDEDLNKWVESLSSEDREQEFIQDMLSQAASSGNVCYEFELFDHAEIAFVAENYVIFRFPEGYGLTKRELAILESPDVVWAYPYVSIGARTCVSDSNSDARWKISLDEWDNHMVIAVLLIDG
jgi:hypothetical protein